MRIGQIPNSFMAIHPLLIYSVVIEHGHNGQNGTEAFAPFYYWMAAHLTCLHDLFSLTRTENKAEK